MENNTTLLGWPYYFHGKSVEELTQSLLLELETTRLRAQEEMKIRDNQFAQLKNLLNRTIRERDEAQQNCQKLIFEKLILQNQLQTTPLSGLSSIEDEPIRENGFSSSDCEESIVSSPVLDPIPLPSAPAPVMVPEEELPERGKFLQAVMKAGPLLGTLLLAGPLPQWRHPPPPLDSRQIPPPPVAVPPSPAAVAGHLVSCDRVSKKRGLCEGCDSSMDNKYQRIFPN